MSGTDESYGSVLRLDGDGISTVQLNNESNLSGIAVVVGFHLFAIGQRNNLKKQPREEYPTRFAFTQRAGHFAL